MNQKNINIQTVVLLTTTILLLVTNTGAQISINSNDIQGIEILRSDTIVGKSLWGLIDGGADLYFEYGFLNVTVQEILLENYHFKIETYMMIDENAAFGIFSVSHQQCNEDTLAKWCCITPYQIQIARGNYYFSVVNDSGTTNAINLGRRICENILKKIDKKELTLPSIFENELLKPHLKKLKYITGTLGLQNGYPLWDDKFSSLNKFKAYILPIEIDTGFITISIITFEKAEDVKQFASNINLSESPDKLFMDNEKVIYKYFRKIVYNKIIYLESDISSPLLQKYIQAIETTR